MNELSHLAEFQEILENPKRKYQPSEASKTIVKQTSIALFAGPTSAGKNTIIAGLLPLKRYYFVVSDTTRQPKLRNGKREEDGVNYWFRTEAEVLEDLEKGNFVEAAIIHEQQVSGMSVREIAQAKKESKTAVTDIETIGAESVRAIKPDTICLFVIPPSFEQWQTQLHKRGDLAGSDGTEFCKRLRSSVREFKAALKHSYYWFVVNDNLDEAVRYVDTIVTAKRVDAEKQKKGRALVEDLLKKTTEYLAQHPQ